MLVRTDLSKANTADLEVIATSQINDAYEHMLRSDIKYRFSIDMSQA